MNHFGSWVQDLNVDIAPIGIPVEGFLVWNFTLTYRVTELHRCMHLGFDGQGEFLGLKMVNAKKYLPW